MWNISTWSAKYLDSHHFKWQTRPGRGQNSTACCGGVALGSAFWFLCSGMSISLDASSSSGSGDCAGSLASIGRNASLSHREIGESTQVLSGHSSYHCAETSLQSSMSPNTDKKHAGHHLWTLHAPELPCEVYFSTRVIRFACSSSVHSRSMRCALSLESRQVVFHWHVSIPTTSWSSKAWQSLSSGAPHTVELLCFQSR